MELNVAEMFGPVLQGEGKSLGEPAFFLRLSNCNLMSIGYNRGISQPKIWMNKGGEKNIQDVKPDDVIWATNENGNLVETKVLSVFEYDIKDRVELIVEGIDHPVYCSGEHPWLTNQGWKRADELLKDDEIMHFSKKQIQSERMKKYNPIHDPDTMKRHIENTNWTTQGEKIKGDIQRRKAADTYVDAVTSMRRNNPEKYAEMNKNTSVRMTTNNPMFNQEVVKKSRGTHQNINQYYPFMSKSEKDFSNIAMKMGLPVKYIGRFDLQIKHKSKTYYPDFIIEGTNRLLEIYYSKGKLYSHRNEQWKKERLEAFEANGYSCTFVNCSESNINDIKDLISTEIKMQNGVKIISVTKVNQFKTHYEGEKSLSNSDTQFNITTKPMRAIDIMCYPYHNFIVDGMVTHNCGGHNGEKVRDGSATWWCDSEKIWRESKSYTPGEIIEYIKDAGELDNIRSGSTHLVITGGEPLLRRNIDPLKLLIEMLRYDNLADQTFYPYIEVETNGTCSTEDFLDTYVDQVNCSPKLANSGVPREQRIKQDAIEEIKNHLNSWFKFVVSKPEDWNEIEKDFLPLIFKDQIILMPAGASREDLLVTSPIVWEMACKHNVKATTRLQTITWDKRVGV